MSVALSPTPVVAPLSTITWAATPDAPSHAAARPPSTTTWVGRRERSEGASDGHARWLKALAEDPHLRAGLNIHEGHICAELKIEPRVAREKLRAAIREPKKSRTWRRLTNHVSRGNGQRGHPRRRKRAQRSVLDSMCS